MRVLSFVCAVALGVPLAAQEAPQHRLTFAGLVLVNGFYNTAQVFNSDVPLFVDDEPGSAGAAGGAIRQTRMGLFYTEPDVLGGSFTGEVDMDFFGGQLGGGRTFPLARLRRVLGTLAWSHFEVMVGQETPLVADREPRSLAAVGYPDFSTSGNLWLWIPQARVMLETGSTVRLAIQAAVLAPTAGTPQPTYYTQADSAERTGLPYLQGRLRLGWGPSDDPSEIAVGGHVGWLRNLDSLTGDSTIVSRAVTADVRFKRGAFELIGEAFVGQALAGLGGGGIRQNIGVQGVPIRTRGGWAQINVRPSRPWLVGAGCGLDDPEDDDVPGTGRLKNVACEGHGRWEPAGPLVLGLEYRWLETTYRSGTYVAGHVNVAVGFRF